MFQVTRHFNQYSVLFQSSVAMQFKNLLSATNQLLLSSIDDNFRCSIKSELLYIIVNEIVLLPWKKQPSSLSRQIKVHKIKHDKADCCRTQYERSKVGSSSIACGNQSNSKGTTVVQFHRLISISSANVLFIRLKSRNLRS